MGGARFTKLDPFKQGSRFYDSMNTACDEISCTVMMIVFTTRRYTNRPLVIRGPGAGAEVTAAGVFSEIISIGNKNHYGFN